MSEHSEEQGATGAGAEQNAVRSCSPLRRAHSLSLQAAPADQINVRVVNQVRRGGLQCATLCGSARCRCHGIRPWAPLHASRAPVATRLASATVTVSWRRVGMQRNHH